MRIAIAVGSIGTTLAGGALFYWLPDEYKIIGTAISMPGAVVLGWFGGIALVDWALEQDK